MLGFNKFRNVLKPSSDNILIRGYYVTLSSKVANNLSENRDDFEEYLLIRSHIEQGVQQNLSPKVIIQEAKDLLEIDLDIQDISAYVCNVIEEQPGALVGKHGNYLEIFEGQLTGEVSKTTFEYQVVSYASSNSSSRSHTPDSSHSLSRSHTPDSSSSSSITITPQSDGIPIEYIIIGGIVVVGLLAAVVYYFWKRRKPPQDGSSGTGSAKEVPKEPSKEVSKNTTSKFSVLFYLSIYLALILLFFKMPVILISVLII